MAITKQRKEELVADYGQMIANTDGFIVTEYRGLSVKQLNDLRGRLREAGGGSYSITKNTLFMRALEAANWPVPESLLVGPTAVVFGNGNLPAMAKAVQSFAKDNPDLFVVKGGVIAGDIFAAKDVERIASLPTIDEIHAKLAGLLVQPATALASLLNSATSQVVNVLHAYVQENTKEGEAA